MSNVNGSAGLRTRLARKILGVLRTDGSLQSNSMRAVTLASELTDAFLEEFEMTESGGLRPMREELPVSSSGVHRRGPDLV